MLRVRARGVPQGSGFKNTLRYRRLRASKSRLEPSFYPYYHLYFEPNYLVRDYILRILKNNCRVLNYGTQRKKLLFFGCVLN